MYKTIILILLGVFATTSVEAKKVHVLATPGSVSPTPIFAQTRDASGNCMVYLAQGAFFLIAHVHRNTLASVVAVSDSGEATLDGPLTFDTGFTYSWRWASTTPFVIPQGEHWSLSLVLQGANGKMRVIDAMEFASGDCLPLP